MDMELQTPRRESAVGKGEGLLSKRALVHHAVCTCPFRLHAVYSTDAWQVLAHREEEFQLGPVGPRDCCSCGEYTAP